MVDHSTESETDSMEGNIDLESYCSRELRITPPLRSPAGLKHSKLYVFRKVKMTNNGRERVVNKKDGKVNELCDFRS